MVMFKMSICYHFIRLNFHFHIVAFYFSTDSAGFYFHAKIKFLQSISLLLKDVKPCEKSDALRCF